MPILDSAALLAENGLHCQFTNYQYQSTNLPGTHVPIYPLPHPELIIFDVDGTLVDVTRSYRETAPTAARIYLGLLGLQPPVLTGDVYDTFKRMTGFNDDWDLTAGLLRVLLAGLPPASPLPDQAWADLDALIAALQAASQPLAGLTPPLPDWEPLVACGAGGRRRAWPV